MIKAAVKAIVRKLGYELVRPDYESRYADFEAFHRDVVKQVGPYTVTTPERIHALIESVRHCIRNHVEGAFVECGVYKGGSMMAVALALHIRRHPAYDAYPLCQGLSRPNRQYLKELWRLGLPLSLLYTAVVVLMVNLLW